MQQAEDRKRLWVVAALGLVVVLAFGTGYFALDWFDEEQPLPSFRAQACALPNEWLERIERGHFPGHSGDISILPRTPAYMASGAGGWSHSGPWEYLQDVPLVFYGPGVVDEGVTVDRPVTLADVVPTFAALVKGTVQSDGERLTEAADISGKSLAADRPALVLTVVWDGGGWNSLEQWPDAWPELRALMDRGVSYENATVGSSPSVTPSIHTTLGTGYFPSTHGISGIPVKDENGEVADSFLKGESAEFLQVSAFAERWDEQNDNEAEVGMIGYEPWHLGMVGAGAERPGGDKDDAVWLDIETNEWTTQPDHYRLPPSIVPEEGVQAALEDELEELDAADGQADGAWLDNDILDEVDRLEETPAFIRYHGDAMKELIETEGYGNDEVTDFLFTNFKQIDRVGHYFSMESDEVRDSIEASDAELGRIVDFLDAEVGAGRYVVVVTADHGMQPDEEVTDGFGINPTELEEDLKEEFGDVIRGVWPTEVFFFPEALEEGEVSVEEVARFIGDYRVEDNVTEDTGGFGSFEPDDRLFDMAVPADLLEGGFGC